jgi:crossover junction endodeoxyribonuclease RuvC
MTKKKTRYLGVDPGTNVLGYSVIEIEGQKIKVIEIGVVTMSHLEDHPEKLKKIFERLREVIITHRPNEMAIEAPFYAKNVQSMLKLGRAQGVAIAVAMVNGLDVTEYSPRKIKQSITGKGSATKEQVAAMLETILHTQLDNHTLDATDALAAAVCHHFQKSAPLAGLSKAKGWSDFIKNNPNRVK